MTRNLDGTKRVLPGAKVKTETQKRADAKRGAARRNMEAKLAKIAKMRANGVVI